MIVFVFIPEYMDNMTAAPHARGVNSELFFGASNGDLNPYAATEKIIQSNISERTII